MHIILCMLSKVFVLCILPKKFLQHDGNATCMHACSNFCGPNYTSDKFGTSDWLCANSMQSHWSVNFFIIKVDVHYIHRNTLNYGVEELKSVEK